MGSQNKIAKTYIYWYDIVIIAKTKKDVKFSADL